MTNTTDNKSHKISKQRQKKEEIIAELLEIAKRAKGFVFTNYQGMTHKQIEELKQALKKSETDLVVTKNTLLKLTLEKVSKDGKVSRQRRGSPEAANVSNGETFDTFLNGPTATLFIHNDIVAPLKALAKSIKTLKLPLIKSGIIEGRMLAETEILRLSTLPSREVLIAQVVGGMKSPLYGLHRALNWNLQKLVIVLKAIETKKIS